MKRITIEIQERKSRAEGYNLRVRSCGVGGVSGYEERMAGEVIADLAEFIRGKLDYEAQRRAAFEAQQAERRAAAIASETKLYGESALSQIRAELAERLTRMKKGGRHE